MWCTLACLVAFMAGGTLSALVMVAALSIRRG
jgi:hypothetical protein